MSRHIFAALAIFLCLFTNTSAQQRPIDHEFLDAVQKKDVPKINQLLSRGANINAQDYINGYFALQYAINWPDLALVKLLLDKGANINLADSGGTTALIEACDSDGPVYQAIIKLLIDRGANIHANKDQAILRAVKYSSAEVVRLLLSKGAPVNVRDKDLYGNTVLIEAASGSSVETVRMLLAAGADLKATNDEGENALMKAVELDHRYQPAVRLPMIELLIAKGTDVNAKDKKGATALLHSVVQYMSEAGGIISHPEVVKLLLERGAEVGATDESGNNALIITVGEWQTPIEIPGLLLAKGIAVNVQNKQGVTALMVAAEKGKTELVNLLLDHGGDLNLKDAQGFTVLDYAVNNGQTQLAKTLLSKGAASKNNYKSEAEMLVTVTNFALLEAASRTNLAQVKAQLDAGADINSRSRLGKTPLMLAVEYGYGRSDVPQLLIEKGANLNAVDNDGNTALMIAIDRNNTEAAQLLLKNKAAVSPRNKDGRTALHIAAAGVRRQPVGWLLAAGPDVTASSAGVDLQGLDVNAPDGSGRTPLMLAADNEGYVPDDVMELLLSKGARIDAQDPNGNTALILAARAGSMAGVEYLLQKGAAVNLKNAAGETALQWARKLHENPRIINAKLVEDKVVAMLLRAGAK